MIELHVDYKLYATNNKINAMKFTRVYMSVRKCAVSLCVRLSVCRECDVLPVPVRSGSRNSMREYKNTKE